MWETDAVWWRTVGKGPAVVVPWLNVDWTKVDLSALTHEFKVVIVAPRGFGPSARPGGYDAAGVVADVDHVVRRLGIGTYATFGYSMSGAMAARLALRNPRVTAVACGGFPLTADLSGMGLRARRGAALAHQDPAAWAAMVAAYDPDAGAAFWDDIAALPAAALADVDCPVRAWWGEQDEILSSLLAPEELSRDLERRGIQYDVVPGLDHDGMLNRLDMMLPTIATWLVETSRKSATPSQE